MKERKEHKELLSLWGIKSNVTQGQLMIDLTGSWHCSRCTYLNEPYTQEYTCKVCASVDMVRSVEIKKQILHQENLASEVTKSLHEQNDLLNDLDDDSEIDDMDDGNLSKLETVSQPLKMPDFRYIAPTAIGKQLHMSLLPDLLLDCLLFLGNPQDVINVLLVNKYFSWVADNDAIWWSFQSRFINDPSSTSSTESRKELFTSPSSSRSSASRSNQALSDNAIPSETWVCSQCQLTQALATSTHCEMCLTERPLSYSQRPSTPAAQAAFVIIRSAEHLAALWVEGNRNHRKHSNSENVTDGVIARSREGDALSSSEDPLTGWAWYVGLPGAPFTIDRAQAAHTVRPHTMHKQAGKWYYRCKIACLERKSRQLWQSIHRGWEWIRNDLRCRIRQKWLLVYVTGDEEHVLATGKSYKPSASSAATSSNQHTQSKRPRISGICESNTYKACHTSEESEAHVRAIRNEAEEVKENLKASETLRRALRKLTTLNWVLCYESIKAELSLQAEALALELKALWVLLSNTSRSDAPQPSSSVSGSTAAMHAGSLGALPLESCQLFLEKLNRACVVFISCADELEENCCSLNDEIAKDKDIYRDTTGYSTKNVDEHTGLLSSQGTPSISDMALIALRNHGMLSHWTADSVLHCMSVVGGHAEGEHPSDPILSSLSSSSVPSSSMKSSLHDGGSRKRKIEETDSFSTTSLKDDNSSESVISLQRKSVKLLLQLYDLCEVLDVEDDLLSPEKSTQAVFKRRYIHFLCSLPCLASSIRVRNNALNVQASKNRSNQWDGDDIHFSYTRQRGCAREGPFDPRRDKKINFLDQIQEDQRIGFETSSDFEITTHVLKVSAISSSETFHADFDPKAIRRRQLIEQYQ